MEKHLRNGAQSGSLGDHFGTVFMFLFITWGHAFSTLLVASNGRAKPTPQTQCSQFRWEPLSYMRIRRRSNKPMYTYIYIYMLMLVMPVRNSLARRDPKDM